MSDRLRDFIEAWDRQTEAESPLVQHRWTNIALWPASRGATVAGSTGIEGNPLTATEVDDVLVGAPPASADVVHIREVLNYNDALDLANRASLRPDFEWTQELLRRLNATVMRGLEDDERGEYRHEPVTVGNGLYSPPEFQRLPDLMAQFVEWLRSGSDCHPVVRAGLTHLNLVSIHPWLNGNGRTARVAGSLMMMRCGVGTPELLNVESAIRANTDRYFAALQHTQGPDYDPENHTATEWLEYVAELCVGRLELRNGLLAATQSDVGLLTLELVDLPGTTQEWVPILLSARMAPIRVTDMARRLSLSPARVRAMVAAMARDGWLSSVGERRGRHYVAGPRLNTLPLRSPELMASMREGRNAN